MTIKLADSLEGLTIKRTSTAEQVATVLRERILRGDIQAGTPLREVALAASIGVSRNTMREAVRVLIHEGLVRHNIHRGITVSKLSEKDIVDIYRVRKILEPLAVETGSFTTKQLALIESAVIQLERAAEGRDWPLIVENDMLFHRQLVASLGSQRLSGFFQNLLAELRLGLVLVDRASGDVARLGAQHREFYRLLASGKQRDCALLLREHLGEAELLVRAIFAVPPEPTRR